MRKVADLLPRAVRRTSDREALLAAVVLDAVGTALTATLPAPLARRVRPVSFRDGAVSVRADSSVVASEVRMLAERIRTRTLRTLKRRGFPVEVRELRVQVA